MANKLTSLRFDQAANLVDDPANPKAIITLFKRGVAKDQPAAGNVHVDVPNWRKQDVEHFAAVVKYIRQVDEQYCVFSEAGKNLGCHDTKADAVQQLRAIEVNKCYAWLAKEAEYLHTKRRSWQ
jgi:hypothetical protein